VKRGIAAAIVILGSFAAPALARAAEISHFNGGIANMRDYFIPEPGFYGLIYNYYYTTDQLNDGDGDEVDTFTLNPGPGPGLTVDVDVVLDVYVLAPALIWAPKWRPFGAKYAAYVLPTLATNSVQAGLSTATRVGGSVSNDAGMGVGDLFVQPLWLGWAPEHWDLALGYGFYAPVGRYDTKTVSLPLGASVEVESPDSIGLGFWTHQIQGALAWYPWLNKATAVTAVLTYEINQQKRAFDLTPGQNLTFNWGVSQYLPLRKDQHLLLEVGPAGYSSWQTTHDTGSDARNGTRDQVHAAGGQIGLAYVPWNLALTFHAFAELAAEARFQGDGYGINVAKKF
jgi:hypothetical protein